MSKIKDETIVVHFHVPKSKVGWFLWVLLSSLRPYVHGVEYGSLYYRKPADGRMYFRHLGLGREPKLEVIVSPNDKRSTADISGLSMAVQGKLRRGGIKTVQQLAASLRSKRVSEVLGDSSDQELELAIKALAGAKVIAIR